MSKKILVTGSQGLLGSSIVSNNSYGFNFISTTLNPSNRHLFKLDIRNGMDVKFFLEKHEPDVIINCAAYTDVDSSIENKMKCHDVNVNGLLNLLKYSNKRTKLVHISTDYVFDGCSSENYEESITRPINYYGKTKLESENVLKGASRKFIIFRPNVLYSEFGYNFFTFIYNSLKKKKSINIVTDQSSNPVYVPFFSNVILDSILMDLEGVYHYGSSISLSRYDFALKIADFFNFDNNLIIPISSENLNQKERRPINTTLDCSKIQKALDIEIYSINDSFHQMVLS